MASPSPVAPTLGIGRPGRRFFRKEIRMGDLVNKKAAAGTIMSGVEATYEKAKALGGRWFELAER